MTKKISVKKVFRDFILNSLEVLLITFVIFLILNIFLGQLLVVTGNSMDPTLKDQEQILGEKLSLNFVEPKRGEIFIFRQPQDNRLLIKRLIALPDERVLIKDGKVYINDTALKEDYLHNVPTEAGEYIKEGQELTVPKESYLFLGDNREQSLDGREWGFVNKDQLESRALVVYFPVKNFRIVNK
jgi:signal peptidase I